MRSTNSTDPEDVGDEGIGGPSRGSSRSMWSQRRPAKRRTRERAKRGQANSASSQGMHLRRNKRMGW